MTTFVEALAYLATAFAHAGWLAWALLALALARFGLRMYLAITGPTLDTPSTAVEGGQSGQSGQGLR